MAWPINNHIARLQAPWLASLPAAALRQSRTADALTDLHDVQQRSELAGQHRNYSATFDALTECARVVDVRVLWGARVRVGGARAKAAIAASRERRTPLPPAFASKVVARWVATVTAVEAAAVAARALEEELFGGGGSPFLSDPRSGACAEYEARALDVGACVMLSDNELARVSATFGRAFRAHCSRPLVNWRGESSL